MKIEITKVQIESIKSMADDISAMVGKGESDKDWVRYIKNVDKMLETNKLPKRRFN